MRRHVGARYHRRGRIVIRELSPVPGGELSEIPAGRVVAPEHGMID
ncbi:MAG TPA: hypothetical protein VIY09_03990 [Rhizomicrobium sp.]